MRIIDTAQVLARIQAFNNRTVDEAVITAWHEILEPYELADCLRAVTEYFARSKDWVMPADITSRVSEYRTARINEFKNGLQLSEADERAAGIAGTWPAAQRELHRLAGNGHLTPTMYDEYQAGNIRLQDVTKKAITK